MVDECSTMKFPTKLNSATKGRPRPIWGVHLLVVGLFLLHTVLKKSSLYEPIWASQFSHQVQDELLKFLMARWCPNTNTIHTCYRELGISLWDIFHITGLLIAWRDEFFPTTTSLRTRSSHTPQGCYFRGGKVCLREINAPNTSSGWKNLLRITLITREKWSFYLFKGKGYT